MMQSFKDRWDALGPSAKRGLAVGGIVAAGMGIVSIIANFAPEPAPKTDKQQVVKHILTDSDPRSLGIDGLATQLKQVAQKNEDLLRRLAGLEEEQKRSRLSDEERLRRMNEEQATSHQGQLESLRSEIESLRRAKEAVTEKSDLTGTQSVLPSAERERLPRLPSAKPPTHQVLDALFAQPPVRT